MKKKKEDIELKTAVKKILNDGLNIVRGRDFDKEERDFESEMYHEWREKHSKK